MKCKSCGADQVHWRSLCISCAGDYRYTVYRKHLEKKQAKAGKPISEQWARKPKWKYKDGRRVII